MKRLLLSLGLLFGLTTAAFAQCVGVGSVNNAPPPGINCQTEPVITTYAAMGYGIVPAASATDVACITGSATKVVRVQRVRVSGTAGTLVTLPVLLTKHTVANTGGTAATSTALPVPGPLDSTNAAASATTTAYTANPTVDATATRVDARAVSLNTTAALVTGPEADFNYTGQRYSQAPVLRGVAQQLCVNLGGISVTSGLLAVSFEWTEAAQ